MVSSFFLCSIVFIYLCTVPRRIVQLDIDSACTVAQIHLFSIFYLFTICTCASWSAKSSFCCIIISVHIIPFGHDSYGRVVEHHVYTCISAISCLNPIELYFEKLLFDFHKVRDSFRRNEIFHVIFSKYLLVWNLTKSFFFYQKTSKTVLYVNFDLEFSLAFKL